MKKLFYISAALLAQSSPSFAQEAATCASYQDKIVQPITIDSAIALFKGAQTPKSEFETTAQYQARQKSAIGGNNGPLIISKTVDPQYIKYDADTQDFVIQTYLFDNANMSYDVLGYDGPIRPTSLGSIDALITQVDTPDGTYEASNAYGATAKVAKIKRVTKGVWERATDSLMGELFATGKNGSTLLSVKLPPDRAKFMKDQLRIAFVVEPKSPYIVHGVGTVGRTTVTRPIQITDDLTILIADIQCGLLMDSTNKVLGSFPTG